MERLSFMSQTGKRSGEHDSGSSFGSVKRLKTRQQSPLPVPAGHAVFRMLCLVSQVGAVIGKSGSVIKQLQQSTGAKIRVEEAPSECPDRVITVIAQVGVKSRVKLGVGEEEGVEVSKAQEALIRVFEVLVGSEVRNGTVSCRLLTEANHAGAVIGKGGKMVEKIRKETGCKVSVRTDNMPACADPDEEMVEIEGTVLAVKNALVSVSSCLQDCQPHNKTRTVGSRSLDRVFQETLRRPTDEVVREALPRPVEVASQDFRLRTVEMFSHDSLLRPIEVIPRDAFHRRVEMVPQNRHIEVVPQDAFHRPFNLASRDALYRPSDMVSADFLHMHREVDPHNALQRPIDLVRHDALGRPLEPFPQDNLSRHFETMPHENHTRIGSEFHSHRYSVQDSPPRRNITFHSTSIKTPPPEMRAENQEVVFKILCSTENAGGIIGKGGNVVRNIHNETGASINVGNTLSDCDERLIAVTASEDPEDQNSPAQKAIMLVLSRLFNLASMKVLDNGSKPSITARLVVPTNQIGCLLGKGGSIVSEMRKTTGAVIQVLKVEQNPKCVMETDQVVQISGEFPNVKQAMFHVTSRLRDNLFANSMKNAAIKGNVSVVTERDLHGKSDDPTPAGSHPSFSRSLPISTSLHGRYENSLLSGSHPSINYSKTIGTDSYIRPEDPFPDGFHLSARYSPNFGRQSTMDHINAPNHFELTPSHSWASQPVTAPRGLSDASGGLSSNRAGLVLGSGSKSAIVTNTTVEIRVPESAMNFVYGEDGQILEQLRQVPRKMSSISLRAILDVHKLVGENFDDWYRNLKIVLKHEKILDSIENPIKERVDDDEDGLLAWTKQKDDLDTAKCIILASISSELQREYEDMDPVAIITHLKKMYGAQSRTTRYQLSKTLFKSRLTVNSPVGPHVRKMISLIEQLVKLGYTLGKELSQDLILQSLPETFSPFIVNFNMNKMDMDLHEMLNQLIGYESQSMSETSKGLSAVMMVGSSSKKGKGNKKPKKKLHGSKGGVTISKGKRGKSDQVDVECFFYKKKGHWKRNCKEFL